MDFKAVMLRLKIPSLLLIFAKEEGKILCIFLSVATFSAMLDILGISSIMPLITFLSNPENLISDLPQIVQDLITKINTLVDFRLLLTLLVFVLFVTSLIFRSLVVYFQIFLSMSFEKRLSSALIDNYMTSTNKSIFQRHSSDLVKSSLSEVSNVVSGIIIPLLTIISQGVTTVFVVVFLMILNFKITSFIAAFVITSYAALYLIFGKYLKIWGEKRFDANEKRFHLASEISRSLKEIRIYGAETHFLENFKNQAEIYARVQIVATSVSTIPRYLLELIGLGSVLALLLYYLAFSGEELTDILPQLAIYGLASYRIIPAFQQIYGNLMVLKLHWPALSSLSGDYLINERTFSQNDTKLGPDFKTISMKNVSVSINNTKILKDISFDITKGEKICIVGQTGSGKSTLIETLLGFVPVDPGGEVKIDNSVVSERSVSGYSHLFSYVPQNVVLLDQSLTSNITLSPQKLDKERIIKILELLELQDLLYLVDEDSYSLGEGGKNLSGGQRQRLGIARGLYAYPQILILDEATSALDVITERQILKNINEHYPEITIISVVHKPYLFSYYDKVLFLVNGRVIDFDSANVLQKKHENFDEFMRFDGEK